MKRAIARTPTRRPRARVASQSKPKSRTRVISGASAGRVPWQTNLDLLLAIADEIDLIDGMLDCVPQLSVVARMVRDEGTANVALDPIGHWAKFYGGGRKLKEPTKESDDDSADFRRDILGTPDAMVDTSRWRLQRVRMLLEVLRQQCSGGSHKRGG